MTEIRPRQIKIMAAAQRQIVIIAQTEQLRSNKSRNDRLGILKADIRSAFFYFTITGVSLSRILVQ